MKHTLILATLLLLVLAACTPTPNADTDTQGDTQESANVPAETQKQVAETKPKDDSGNSLLDFFNKKAKIEYQVAYNVASQSQGIKTSATLSQYVKGYDHFRTDTETEGIESRVIVADDKTFICSKQGSWSCFENEQPASSSEQVQQSIEQDPTQYEHNKLPGRTIAGAKTECWEILVENSRVEYCFSKEGVPLYIKSTGTAEQVSYSSEMTATSYSLNVPPNAFVPPATPTSFEDNYADLIAQYKQ